MSTLTLTLPDRAYDGLVEAGNRNGTTAEAIATELTLPTGAALEARVRSIAEEVTGESWATDDLGPLFTMFDLRRAVTRPES